MIAQQALTRIGRAAVFALAGLVTLGCGVSKTTHQEVADELESCRSARDAIEIDHGKLENKLKASADKLQTELEAKDKQLGATKEELEELRAQRAAMDKQIEEFQTLTESFKELIAADDIQVYVRRGRMIVSLPSGVLFPSGKAELSPRGLKTLAQVATKLEDFKDRRFIVAGHTDNEPIKKAVEFKDNWELSTARALRVTRFLIEKGMSPKNLAAAGYSQFDPVKSNKTMAGRRLNRRIELILEPRVPDFAKLKALEQPSPD